MRMNDSSTGIRFSRASCLVFSDLDLLGFG